MHFGIGCANLFAMFELHTILNDRRDNKNLCKHHGMKTKILSVFEQLITWHIWQIAFLLFVCSGISYAQNTTLNQLTGNVLADTDMNMEMGMLPKQDSNRSEIVTPGRLFPGRAGDSSVSKSEFVNSVACSGFVLRLTKSSNFTTIGKPDIHNLRVFGMSYEHGIYRHVTLGIGYYVWKQFAPWYNDVSVYSEPRIIYEGHERGFIQKLNNYKMCDFYGKYALKLDHHQIDAGLGVSYTWGTNTVIDTIYVYHLDNVIISHRERASYGGVFALIGYHYCFLHDRLSVGYEINCRDYFGIYSPFLQNGLSIKFNF